MTVVTESGGDDDIALERLISNAAEAMQRVSKTAEALDDAFGDWLEHAPEAPPPVALLQDVDRIRQTLACFSLLLANLSRQALPDYTVSGTEVMDGVYLGELRDSCLCGPAAKRTQG